MKRSGPALRRPFLLPLPAAMLPVWPWGRGRLRRQPDVPAHMIIEINEVHGERARRTRPQRGNQRCDQDAPRTVDCDCGFDRGSGHGPGMMGQSGHVISGMRANAPGLWFVMKKAGPGQAMTQRNAASGSVVRSGRGFRHGPLGVRATDQACRRAPVRVAVAPARCQPAAWA